jgi:penicillin amidase
MNNSINQTRYIALRLITFCLVFTPLFVCGAQKETLQISGLSETVEIVKDKWGVSHIYARNQSDLFFAQGFNAARDRLFQFEIWRRKASGTLAEIQGDKALMHDRGARLLRFRGDIDAELGHYHEDGQEIIQAFVNGVNAYIKHTQKNPELLPFEFELLGIKPRLWTAETVVSRHNALTGGISTEIMLSKLLTAMEPQQVRKILPFYRDPHLEPFDKIDLGKITDEIMLTYRASRSLPEFSPEDLQHVSSVPGMANSLNLAKYDPMDVHLNPIEAIDAFGSNNWVIAGHKTKSGKPLMANDPHRRIESPSLRYMVHLSAPATQNSRGWNVIGGGEPVLPGISIGHNEHGAWGLTIFRIDQEDLYVYETNPDNENQYRYAGRWKDMEIEADSISVKGQVEVPVILKYSVHGPIIFEDKINHLAYGLKAAWLDVGAAPYLASLRMDQATSWEEFRDACTYSGLPGENMVWADKQGNIGWQAVGLTPVRFGWDGSLPVPGDGRYEWAGYVPIKSMPNLSNPDSGWYGTANHHNVPKGYPNIFSDFYSDPARSRRLDEVLNAAMGHSIEDSMALQYDNKSMNAERITPYFESLKVGPHLKPIIRLLATWNHRMDRDSRAAAVYDQWEVEMLLAIRQHVIQITDIQLSIAKPKLLEWIETTPEFVFGEQPVAGRNKLMVRSLEKAVAHLTKTIGPDQQTWTYGNVHYAEIVHRLSHLVDDKMRGKVNLPPLPRGGASNTLNANHGADRQSAGASFRIIVDTADWDKARGTNTPGQSGNPDSPFYGNTYENWNKGEYFPLYFSRAKIDSVASHVTVMKP